MVLCESTSPQNDPIQCRRLWQAVMELLLSACRHCRMDRDARYAIRHQNAHETIRRDNALLKTIAKALFSSADERQFTKYRKRVEAINALEAEISVLTDEGLMSRSLELRKKVRDGAKVDSILVEGFALVREAAKRKIGQRHYDVQLIGGMTMADGMIAEMRTGEGKTLVATLAAYVNALSGDGVHVVTVNDYLSKRDHDLMAPIYRALGLTTAHLGPDDPQPIRKAAYAADITYTTNNQIGFDHLRDTLAIERDAMVQRPFNFAIVDEVDSILIDEARTPLIISGPAEDNSALYAAIDRIVVRVPRNEVDQDIKEKSVFLKDEGLSRIEEMMRRVGMIKEGEQLHDPQHGTLLHQVTAALRAHHLFQRNKHYIVKDGEIVIVDEFTGRTMPGRRFNEGIHQAIEAKERVAILPESETLASITLQNLFRGYRKLSGMTGTGVTEAKEFGDIYGLGILAIPTNKPVARKDMADMIYRTHKEKIAAVLGAIEEAHLRLQPVLVGTATIEHSEEIAKELLKRGYAQIDFDDAHALQDSYAAAEKGLPSKRFAVLNARQNGQEAYVVGQAGIPGAITIATNMAGRGTDIQLGGNASLRYVRETATLPDEIASIRFDEIAAQTERFAKAARDAGGLLVIGTERHESRRIDNQLRGRSGRQGDPGRSQFYLAFSDDVIKRFGKLDLLADQLELKEGEAISHPLVTGAVNKAQAKQEAHNFEIRKTVIQFDDVVNEQRKAVAKERGRLLDSDDVRPLVIEMRDGWIDDLVDANLPERSFPEQWDVDALVAEAKRVLHLEVPLAEWIKEDDITADDVRDRLHSLVDATFAERVAAYEAIMGKDAFDRDVAKRFALLVLDMAWRDHSSDLDHLKQVVGLRAIGQRDPLSEFRVDASEAFDRMVIRWHEFVTLEIMRPHAPARQAA